jgi:hypothetical protein
MLIIATVMVATTVPDLVVLVMLGDTDVVCGGRRVTNSCPS